MGYDGVALFPRTCWWDRKGRILQETNGNFSHQKKRRSSFLNLGGFQTGDIVSHNSIYSPGNQIDSRRIQCRSSSECETSGFPSFGSHLHDLIMPRPNLVPLASQKPSQTSKKAWLPPGILVALLSEVSTFPDDQMVIFHREILVYQRQILSHLLINIHKLCYS